MRRHCSLRKDVRRNILITFIVTLLFIPLFSLGETSAGIGATSGTCGTNLTWKLASGTLTSGAPWEAVKSQIESVVINSGATSVGDFAFNGCSNLTNVSLPTTIQTIGDSSFSGCSKLPSIALRNKVKSLGESAFANCSALKSISLPTSLISIGYYCFSSSGLRTVSIPNGVTEIGSAAFSWCDSLTRITFPEGLTLIPYQVAFYSNKLEEVIIGDGTEEIAPSAFGYTGLIAITIPATLTSVSASAFNGCKLLSDVNYLSRQLLPLYLLLHSTDANC